MKTRFILTLCFCLLPSAFCLSGHAQGTAFTYNGRLADGGTPVTGSYDFQFTIYDATTAGTVVAGPATSSDIGVTNGVFMVTLDFGSGVFTSADRWLDIAVRPHNGGVFISLTPREKFTASPYAIYSGNAAGVAAGSVGTNQLATSGSPGAGQLLTFNGNLLSWVDPTAIGWGLGGNSGTTAGVNFIGTTDNQPLELWVSSSRGFRLEYSGQFSPFRIGADKSGEPAGNFTTSVNVIGGFEGNEVLSNAQGVTISGGGYSASGQFGGYFPNRIGAAFASIGGGASNSVNGLYGTVAGGHDNSAPGFYATIPGGDRNVAVGVGSFAAGIDARANHAGAFVWGDGTSPSSSTATRSWDVLATGGVNFHTGNNSLTVHGPWCIVNGAGNEQAYLGGDGTGGDVQLGSFNAGIMNVALYNTANNLYMNLYAANATVHTITITGGADLAEPFEFSGGEIPKGSVVSIDERHPGQLKISDRPYDTRVAGVVSGASGIRPGIRMRQEGAMEGSEDVALSGRVYVRADTSNGAIRPGDLLTTSGLPGDAMKVTDHERAHGAILGKAMSGLSDGSGFVLMLVTLQ